MNYYLDCVLLDISSLEKEAEVDEYLEVFFMKVEENE
jgi:hypothetical protein